MFIVRWLIQIVYAPGMLFGCTCGGIYLISNGYGYETLFALFLAAIAVSFIAERVVPYDKTWNKDKADSKRDVLHAVVNEVANGLTVAALPVVATILPDFGVWPTQWPLAIQLIFTVLIADFGVTLVHYFSHKYPFLWKFHAVHHSVKRMYGFNGLMKHPVHQMIELMGGTLPLVLLGMPLDIAALLGLTIGIQLLLQHSNVDVKIGPLRYVFALSPVHRFHHVKSAEGDVNFGLFTTFWDHMVGTAVFDQTRKFTSDDLGIGKEPDYPDAYAAQIMEPFKPKREATVTEPSS
ncbi:MAG: fatty acid hydroxylase [Kordiimonadales bacterium]|nr:MAG: fatty acid hydroxylase [Kordiimonadales bacterium]